MLDGLNEFLTLVAAEVRNGSRFEVNGNTALIYHETDADSVTAIGLAGGTEGVELNIVDGRYAIAQITPDETGNSTFELLAWSGSADNISLFEQMLSGPAEMPDFRNGGPERWTEAVRTHGHIAPDTTTYVKDELTSPVPNPWNRNVRVVDMGFFSDRRAAVVTFEGDVWIVGGIDSSLISLQWCRFASGLYEPQSLTIVDDNIYVYGKEGIVRLHDINGNGTADYYENFSNLMAQSIESREWASDMVSAPDGGFYVGKGAALDMGPVSSDAVISGIRAGSQHSGSILKVAPDGRSIKTIATGFRGPYIGVHPETGILTASDQQGHHVPSSRILLINAGDYYGVSATAHRDPVPEITPVLTWIPHQVDQSWASQVWITSSRMGSLSWRAHC